MVGQLESLLLITIVLLIVVIVLYVFYLKNLQELMNEVSVHNRQVPPVNVWLMFG